MVEFALMLPVIVMILFGIIELGRAIYQQNTLSKALDSGVRYMTRSWDTVTAACAQDPTNWSPAAQKAADLVATGSEVGTGAALLPGLDASRVTFSVASRTESGSGTACVIIGTVSVPFVSIFGGSVVPFTDIADITLGDTIEGRYHGD